MESDWYSAIHLCPGDLRQVLGIEDQEVPWSLGARCSNDGQQDTWGVQYLSLETHRQYSHCYRNLSLPHTDARIQSVADSSFPNCTFRSVFDLQSVVSLMKCSLPPFLHILLCKSNALQKVVICNGSNRSQRQASVLAQPSTQHTHQGNCVGLLYIDLNK